MLSGGTSPGMELAWPAGPDAGLGGLPPIGVPDADRRLIAQEIHDVVGQALTSVHLSLMAALATTDRPALERRLDASLETVRFALDEVRALANDLRSAPVPGLDLADAVRGLVGRQAALSTVECTLRICSLERNPPADVAAACLRIVQEAVTNVQRHAGARRLEVRLDAHEAWLDLRIVDDGRGFDVNRAIRRAAAAGNLGLIGMRERALLGGGHLDIRSAPGRGTEVHARFPA